jgi:asparagine N-glycosylation enzyme membrane subunit Stt3
MAGKKDAVSRHSGASSEDDENSFISKSFVVAMFGATIGTIILLTSYNIRTMAIDEFGPVIHEFDPYFNLRATEVSL